MAGGGNQEDRQGDNRGQSERGYFYLSQSHERLIEEEGRASAIV